MVNGSGVMGNSDYPFVDINCNTITTGNKVYMLENDALESGESLVVALNGGEQITLTSWDFNPKPFTTTLVDNAAYEVSIVSAPTGKVCYLQDSVGVISPGSSPEVKANCAPDTYPVYTIGGAVTGLTGDGLEISLDGRITLPIGAAETSYTFAEAQPNYTTHSVSIKTQPSGQICSVTNDLPFIWDANFTTADIICSSGPHAIGGFAAGVQAPGLLLSLNGSEELPLPSGGEFTFTTLLSDNMDFEVSIVGQPPGQVCTMPWNSSTAINKSWTTLVVDCAVIDYAVAVNVAGYASTSPLLLQLNGDEILTIDANTPAAATFTPMPFATRLRDTEAYSVTIAGQPADQTCELTNPAGTVSGADVTNIGVYCFGEPASAGPYTVSVSTSGLLGSGLVLQLNGANDLAISADGYDAFATTLADLASYDVTVLDQPGGPLQHCEVVNGSGAIAGANVTHVSVQCGNAVRALYPNNGSQWLAYVRNDGADSLSASDSACDVALDSGGYDACLHGGEMRVVQAPHLANCTGVTASDSLGAFDWTCDDSTGAVRVISTGLKNGVGMRLLIDFDEVAFKPNSVTITDGITPQSTQSVVWWPNKVRTNNTGDIINSGEIILYTGSVSSGPTMKERTAVLVQAGYVLHDTIFGNGADYLWVEGDVSGATSNGVNLTGSRFSVVQDVQSTGNGAYGVHMGTGSGDNRIHNIVANDNLGSYGIYLGGNGGYDAHNLTANNNGLSGASSSGAGILISGGDNMLTNLSAADNHYGRGVVIAMDGPVTADNIIATNNGNSTSISNGISISGGGSNPVGSSFSNLVSTGNKYTGVYFNAVGDAAITNVTAQDNGHYGIIIGGQPSSSPARNLVASGNNGIGVDISRWDGNRVIGVISSNNAGVGFRLHQSDHFQISDVVSSNNGGAGVVIDSSENVLSANVVSANNNGAGIEYLATYIAEGNALLGGLSVNNFGHGYDLAENINFNLSGVAAINNGGTGFITHTFIDYVTLADVISSNNTGYGFEYGSDYDYYTGLLEMGNNGQGDCVRGGGIINQPGFGQGGSPGNPSTDCVLAGASDGTIISSVDASTSMIGKVSSDDTVNPDDDALPGTAVYDAITSWTQFDHVYRTWGFDGTLAFADDGNQGPCATTNTCRIWDWSAAIADVGNSGAAAMYGILTLPSGNDVLTLVRESAAATGQAWCDSNRPGSTWDGGSACVATYLRHAMEIGGDAIGNDNLLCESGETCLYTPNIGAYQGHGNLVSAGSIGTGGIVENVELVVYENTGR